MLWLSGFTLILLIFFLPEVSFKLLYLRPVRVLKRNVTMLDFVPQHSGSPRTTPEETDRQQGSQVCWGAAAGRDDRERRRHYDTLATF